MERKKITPERGEEKKKKKKKREKEKSPPNPTS